MNYCCEWVKNNINKDTVSTPYPCEWVKQHWADETKQAPYPCEWLENYFETQNLAVSDLTCLDE